MKIVKRFSPMMKIKKDSCDFVTVVTDENKYAKLLDGYMRCGKSFVAVWDSDKPFPENYIVQ